jgi:hypothetical protein
MENWLKIVEQPLVEATPLPTLSRRFPVCSQEDYTCCLVDPLHVEQWKNPLLSSRGGWQVSVPCRLLSQVTFSFLPLGPLHRLVYNMRWLC